VTSPGKIAKAAAGVVVLVVLVIVVNGWYGDYQKASHSKRLASSENSSSVEATLVVPVAGGKKVLILTDGVVLRATPAKGGSPVRTLKKGDQLILVGTVGPWLQLREARNGKMGYVENSTKTLKVQK
jgi:hypothetical protein